MAKIDELALLNCNNNTIAVILDVDVNVMLDQYSKRITQKRAEHRVNLRKRQLDLVDGPKGATMAIFLGKNDLGQADKQEVKHGGNVIIGPPIIK